MEAVTRRMRASAIWLAIVRLQMRSYRRASIPLRPSSRLVFIAPPAGLMASCASCAFRTLPRSEEHTSELQSRGHLVCRLLLEKKKKEQEGKVVDRNETESRQSQSEDGRDDGSRVRERG